MYNKYQTSSEESFLKTIKRLVITGIYFCLLANTSLLAEEVSSTKDLVVNKIISAYGGDKLIGLQSIRIEDKAMHGSGVESFDPNFSEYSIENWDLKIDLLKNRASMEQFSDEVSETYHFRTVTLPNDTVTIDYVNENFYSESGEFYSDFGPRVRTSDTLLAKALSQFDDSAKYLGRRVYAGLDEDVIRFDMPGSSLPITLFASTKTGLINRMQRGNETVTLTYVFGGHRKVNGVSYASYFQFFRNDLLTDAIIDRRVSVNGNFTTDFALDKGITKRAKFIKRGDDFFQKISDDSHLVGQGTNYGVFIDAGEYLITADGLDGLTERLTLYRERTGSTKPLKYLVVTSHWDYMLRSAKEAYELGVNFVISESQKSALENAVGQAIADDRITLIDGEIEIGPVKVYAVDTSVVQNYSVMYVPSIKAIYQAFHYVALYEDEYWIPGNGAGTLKAEIERLELKVDKVISGNSPKIENWQQFSTAIAAYRSRSKCFANRTICSSN